MAVTEHLRRHAQAIAGHTSPMRLRAAIAARGQASLAVSGGKSPHSHVRSAARARTVDWSKVTVVLVDERVVPHDHAASNTALVAQHLLQGPAAQARFLPFFRELRHRCSTRRCTTPWCATPHASPPCPGRWTWRCWAWAKTRTPRRSSPACARLGARAIASDDQLACVVPEQAPIPAARAPELHGMHALLEARELVLSIAGDTKLAVYRRAAEKARPGTADLPGPASRTA